MTHDAAPTTVDIRLLGPLEVSVDGVAVPLGGPRQRALLGLLALRAPELVSVTQLIDGIWDDRPPASATRTLHAHVAYLRKALTGGGLADAVITRAPGYRLAATGGQVDARRFEDLARRGRAAVESGAPGTGVGLLREALGLWRGEVLADCPVGEWARAEAAGLRETRLYAQEDLYAAELTLGQHARVATELEPLVAAEPLRERLWELLVRALYAGGRQSDALGAYRRAREALVELLGLEPGPTLRRLEAAILAGDAAELAELSGGSPAAGPPAAALGLPDTAESALPAPLTRLVGRCAEIAEITATLANRRLVTLTGVGGCGKTRLGIAVAARLTDRTLATRFVDLTGVTDPDLLPTMVATVLGLPVRGDVEPLELLTRQLRPVRLLLVLDNCEHLTAATAALVGPLLAGCPELRVLATSREPLGVPGELVWPVPPLGVPAEVGTLAAVRGYDAVELFLDRAALPAVRALDDADAAALAAICAGLDGLPLAMELAAARTTVLTVREIAARITDPRLLRTARPVARGHHHALEATMAWSYQLLDPDLRSSFRRLAVFRGGFTLDAFAAVTAGREDRAVDDLNDLVSKSLVVVDRRPAGARYRMLETIRQYADDRLHDSPDERGQARQRHATHYRALIHNIDGNPRGGELERLLARLTAEHDNIVAALTWYAEHGTGHDELSLAASLARYCHLRGHYREGRHWLEEALTRSADDPTPELARALLGVAYLAMFECDYAGATRHGERAGTVHETLGDRPGTARSLSLLASVDRERGQYGRSLRRYGQAMSIYRGLGDERGLADTLQMAAFTNWLAGRLRPAQTLLDDALARFRVLDDAEGIASAQVHLAAVAYHAGRHAHARRHAEDALERFRKLDFKEGIAWALNITGLVEQHDGAAGTAAGLLRASLEIHCEVGDRWRSASLLTALAGILAKHGQATTAAELLCAAAAIRDAIGVPVPRQERAAWNETDAAVRRALGEGEFTAAKTRGEAVRFDDIPAWLAGMHFPPDHG